MIRAGGLVRSARRKARLTQRGLAERTGIPQPTIAVIEGGKQDPRFETLRTLLRGCGYDLDLVVRMSDGVDRTLIQENLKLTPGERLRRVPQEARWLATLEESRAKWRAQNLR